MSKSVYVLSLTAAAALGAGTAQLADFDAHAATPMDQIVESDAQVYTLAQLGDATGAQMATAGCASIDAKLGLTGGDKCALADLLSIAIYLNDESNPGKATLKATARIGGSFVARAVP